MTSRATIPPPPSWRPPEPGDGRPAAPQPPTPAAPAVLELELTTPYLAADGHPTTRVVFRRPPGLGELVGWLDESSPEAIGRTLASLPFRPSWVMATLQACAGVPRDAVAKLPARDLIAIGSALRPFVDPPAGDSTGGPSQGSPDSTDGAPETSQS